MSLITEEMKHSVNTIEEVKKLQELVRKLEMQNLHLRNKQNTPNKRSVSPVKELKSRRKISDDENPNSVRDEYFDDLDIIKLSDIEMSDDESWLYKSPKSSKEDHENSFEWLRKDVDDPENRQLQLAKHALLSKVTELGIVGHVDTRTFTRSKKTVDPDRQTNEKHSSSRPRSSDSLSSCHILEFASDVEEVARMQEESLRNSSPFGTPKRGSFGALSRKISSRCSASDQDLSESSLLGISNSESSPGCDLEENNSFTVEPLNHSDQSSSSESPYSSNMSLHISDKMQGKLSGYRRSLPNLNREPLSVKQSKSNSSSDKGKLQNQRISGKVTDTYVQSSQKPRKESPLGRSLHQRSGLNTTPNAPTSVPKSAERVRSGLPRPSRASSATRSATRSGIPMPSMLSKKQEDSWSEGCF
nr:SLAIN motif-containing protein-like [Parasteatoda tepidariorum]